MIKWFIITIVGLYVNVLERPSAVQQPMAKRLSGYVAKFDPLNRKHTHTHIPHNPITTPQLPYPAIQTLRNCKDWGEQGDVITTTSTSIKES